MFCLNIHQTSHFFLLFVVADVIKSAGCSVLNQRIWKVKHELRQACTCEVWSFNICMFKGDKQICWCSQ